jgi:predicted branched-subunit amino acid permease
MSNSTSPYTFRNGISDSIPIGLGYLSVSFGFGVAAATGGLSPLIAIIISLTNMTSAGQVAGVAVMMAAGGLVEMALTQLTINLRYSLMSISLSQKLDASFSLIHRAICGFGITDEIFAVASSKKGSIGPRYLYGLILLPYLSWSLGTVLGALAGSLLPDALKNALGIAIFGMFIAIVLPDAKKSLGVALASLISAAISCALYYIPVFSSIGSGFSIIICALIASAVVAALCPIKDEEVAENE